MAEQPSQQEVDQVRSQTQELAQKAKSDPAFAEQLKSDPAGTLKAQGLPEQAVGELVSKWRQDGAEVSGYELIAVDTCVYYTTIIETDIYCTWFTT